MNRVVIEETNSDVFYELNENEELTYIALKSINERKFILNSGSKLNYININFNNVDDNLEVLLTGENAVFDGKTLTVGNKGNFIFKQNICHKAKQTRSNITNLAIALGDAVIKYETTGHILNKMSKSYCRQLAKGIIVNNDAKISALPILLIDENDVFAYHGAAIGKINDDELFYLMSRGLTKDEAISLLVKALINPILDVLPTNIKSNISEELEKRIKI